MGMDISVVTGSVDLSRCETLFESLFPGTGDVWSLNQLRDAVSEAKETALEESESELDEWLEEVEGVWSKQGWDSDPDAGHTILVW